MKRYGIVLLATIIIMPGCGRAADIQPEEVAEIQSDRESEAERAEMIEISDKSEDSDNDQYKVERTESNTSDTKQTEQTNITSNGEEASYEGFLTGNVPAYDHRTSDKIYYADLIGEFGTDDANIKTDDSVDFDNDGKPDYYIKVNDYYTFLHIYNGKIYILAKDYRSVNVKLHFSVADSKTWIYSAHLAGAAGDEYEFRAYDSKGEIGETRYLMWTKEHPYEADEELQGETKYYYNGESVTKDRWYAIEENMLGIIR
ncbi:MAG: hypothetical protein K6G12_05710 [Lachnospiraceae bacterium]|nr:hypothetical protein [Lachnospiraceae bacterium]